VHPRLWPPSTCSRERAVYQAICGPSAILVSRREVHKRGTGFGSTRRYDRELERLHGLEPQTTGHTADWSTPQTHELAVLNPLTEQVYGFESRTGHTKHRLTGGVAPRPDFTDVVASASVHRTQILAVFGHAETLP
jgi:hypothetical protein